MSESEITEPTLIKKPKKSIDDMSFDELKAYTKTIQENKKKYIRKYQQTDKGKATTRIASQK